FSASVNFGKQEGAGAEYVRKSLPATQSRYPKYLNSPERWQTAERRWGWEFCCRLVSRLCPDRQQAFPYRIMEQLPVTRPGTLQCTTFVARLVWHAWRADTIGHPNLQSREW